MVQRNFLLDRQKTQGNTSIGGPIKLLAWILTAQPSLAREVQVPLRRHTGIQRTVTASVPKACKMQRQTFNRKKLIGDMALNVVHTTQVGLNNQSLFNQASCEWGLKAAWDGNRFILNFSTPSRSWMTWRSTQTIQIKGLNSSDIKVTC